MDNICHGHGPRPPPSSISLSLHIIDIIGNVEDSKKRRVFASKMTFHEKTCIRGWLIGWQRLQVGPSSSPDAHRHCCIIWSAREMNFAIAAFHVNVGTPGEAFCGAVGGKQVDLLGSSRRRGILISFVHRWTCYLIYICSPEYLPRHFLRVSVCSLAVSVLLVSFPEVFPLFYHCSYLIIIFFLPHSLVVWLLVYSCLLISLVFFIPFLSPLEAEVYLGHVACHWLCLGCLCWRGIFTRRLFPVGLFTEVDISLQIRKALVSFCGNTCTYRT